MKKYIYKMSFYILLISITLFGQSREIREMASLIREGRIEEARRFLADIDTKLPRDHIIFMQGLLSTDGNSAAGYYEDLLKKYPNSQYADDALFRLAQLKYAQGLYKTAQQRFFGLLKHYPPSPLHQQSQYWIGICYQAMEQPDSAAYRLEKAIDDYPHTSFTQIVRNDLRNFRDRDQLEKNNFTEPSIQYYVQVGAFSHQPNALLRKSFFESKGHPVVLRSKIKDDNKLCLVWIGPFKTLEKARTAGEQLKKKYGIKYTPVSE